MAKHDLSDDLMMRYLLGDLSDEEQVRLEEHYFVDNGIFEQLSAMEDELVDDYVRGRLRERQRQQFETRFLDSAERRRKLAFAESLAQYLSEVPELTLATKQETWWQRASEWVGGRGTTPRWALAAVGVIVLAAGAGIVRENLEMRKQLRGVEAQQNEMRQQTAQLRSQLAQLKEHSIGGPTIPAGELVKSQSNALPVVALALTPGLLRGGSGEKTLVVPTGPHVVRLQLDLENRTYESYLATLETAEGSRMWSGEQLETSSDGHRRKVVLEIPSSLLANSDYVLKLRGVRNDAKAEEIAEYGFRVVKH